MDQLDLFEGLEPTLTEKFRAFDAANPHVYLLIEKYTLQAIGRGFLHYGIAAIIERVRWHTDMESEGDPFKINNNWKAFYTRKFEAQHPEHVGFFRNRTAEADDE